MKILRSTPFKPFNPRPVEAVGEPDMVLLAEVEVGSSARTKR